MRVAMTLRLVLSTVVVCAMAAAASAADLPASLLDPYLRMHMALAADKMDAVRTDAGALAKAAADAGEPAKKVAEAAQKLERAGDLKAARAAFGDVSDALVAYAKATGATLPSGVKMAFCTMDNKPWLQKGDAIQNPYYGSEMSTCGEFRKP
jgi:hypothetical protein